ncbi:nucleotidyltransferase family protein [Alphaproteobacteria bacterium]|nr:nucleotidyltransferase family protein [Alphaproteobacteria bacterium]
MMTTSRNKSVISGILLAAGASRRMGDVNKLALEIDGEVMVHRCATALLGGGINRLVVVTGHYHDDIAAALAGLAMADDSVLSIVHNPDHASGQAASINCGLAALTNGQFAPPDGVMIALGDMPFVTAHLIAELCHAHDHTENDFGLENPDPRNRITVPFFENRRGNPMIWGANFYPALAKLTGDMGGRQILDQHGDAVYPLLWHDDNVHRDCDSLDDLTNI